MLQYTIKNIPISSLDLKNVQNLIENQLLKNSKPKLITTFNLDFLRIANIDNEFNNICRNSFINLPDGFGITSLIKLKYKKKINRITGNEIFPTLLSICSKNNLKIVILGGFDNVFKTLKAKILSEFEINKNNILHISPHENFEADINLNKSIIVQISEFQPEIVVAALGCPRQEIWLYRNMDMFKSKINIGLGATLDYYTNVKKRSPQLLQKLGLEWSWRLINEPKRLFKRYVLKDLPFYLKLIITKNY